MVKMTFSLDLRGRRESTFLYVISAELLGLSIAMLPCFFMDFFEKTNYLAFLVPVLAGLILFLIVRSATKMSETIKPIDGLFLLGVAWIIAIAFSSIPFMISGFSVADSIFESTSGITTAGITLADTNNISSGLFLWRSITEWIGGLAVILLFMILLPMFGFGSRELLDSGTSFSSDTFTFSLRKKDIARQFFFVYVFLTVVMVLFLVLLNVSPFDSVCGSLATISTGGPVSKINNFFEFSGKIKIVCAVFMFLGSVNFFLHFRAIYYRKFSVYWNNEEFRLMLFWNLMLVAVIYVLVHCDHVVGRDFNPGFVNTLVTVIGATSTTFFVDSEYWPEIITVILFFVVFLGGSAGSTTGGIKISRFVIVLRYIQNGLKSIIHPEAVCEVRLNKGYVENRSVNVIVALVMLFLSTIFMGVAALMICGCDLSIATSTVMALITTSGSSSSGSLELFISGLSGFLKIFLCFIMWLGRLEIISGIILLMPGFWKEFIHSTKRAI